MIYNQKADLIDDITQYIKSDPEQIITGDILQQRLINVIDSLWNLFDTMLKKKPYVLTNKDNTITHNLLSKHLLWIVYFDDELVHEPYVTITPIDDYSATVNFQGAPSVDAKVYAVKMGETITAS